jgi:hypothetical protein
MGHPFKRECKNKAASLNDQTIPPTQAVFTKEAFFNETLASRDSIFFYFRPYFIKKGFSVMSSQFKKINNLLGWGIFLIAAITYISTAAPTTSFWDTGEYISTATKLQVGHPPGAPLFQLMGNFFSTFAMGDVTEEARMVNYLSALSSAFTILFLFWTITMLGRKFLSKYGEMDKGRQVILFGGAVVGALAYTWSDSFWFSAVEGEVYAMSSLFTAMAVKREDMA